MKPQEMGNNLLAIVVITLSSAITTQTFIMGYIIFKLFGGS